MVHVEAGGSLPVPNVQALAQTYNRSDEQIPERYIRVEEATEEVIIDHGISSAIPIIDVSKLLDLHSSKECAKLGSACRQWGFFQINCHTVTAAASICGGRCAEAHWSMREGVVVRRHLAKYSGLPPPPWPRQPKTTAA